MYHRVFSTHLEQVVLAVHTAQLIVNGGYKKSEPKRLASIALKGQTVLSKLKLEINVSYIFILFLF